MSGPHRYSAVAMIKRQVDAIDHFRNAMSLALEETLEILENVKFEEMDCHQKLDNIKSLGRVLAIKRLFETGRVMLPSDLDHLRGLISERSPDLISPFIDSDMILSKP